MEQTGDIIAPRAAGDARFMSVMSAELGINANMLNLWRKVSKNPGVQIQGSCGCSG